MLSQILSKGFNFLELLSDIFQKFRAHSKKDEQESDVCICQEKLDLS